MTNTNRPVDGPYRITTEPIPTGVTLDVEPFVQGIVTDVVEALLTDRFLDRFDGLVDMQARDPHLIERPQDLPFEGLVDDLVAEVRTKLPVYGRQCGRLAERLLTLSLAGQLQSLADRRAAAAQRTERGAAA
ncbi:hypothetical protein OHA98_41775 [Streptomyces sp. NBC_00654]|uniref:hypothetical protein n=1 Tax=Streptomyces sp. NBC_00654 TaxID=2975799 RepID=UPI002257F99A|nr:hypothetical protein [Streptomyces sp. NBC_00654]MCX4969358.1 hypothetical protein [Streptomyces sp. NBC_00654]MCX4971137.1 hypothetical protein [Streptomyces sp. NBC_00654]